MVFRVERSKASIRDLELIFRHLVEAHVAFGSDVTSAIEQASIRLDAIEHHMESLARAPFQGTLWSTKTSNGIRHVTKNKAIFYFSVQAEEQVVRILAIFFGGQDHRRHMLARLRKPATDA